MWVREQNLLALLYPGKIIIPKAAYDELSYPTTPQLKDIALYIKELGLRQITTGDILIEALEKGIITEVEGNDIWSAMLAKRRKLGAGSFTEFLRTLKT